MVRANNMFGIRQFPEKLVPHCIMALLAGDKIGLHGDGSHMRCYLSAQDFASALVVLARQGVPGEIYNIGSAEEYSNREVAKMICDAFGASFDGSVRFVQDRPFNDRRYSLSWDKVARLGWRPRQNLRDHIPALVSWYRTNLDAIRKRQALMTP